MIWLWFLVHMCKMIISPGAFFILAKFWFFRVIREGVEGQKMAQNDKKIPVCLTPYLRNCASYDHDFWWTCAKWWYLQQFFAFFQNFYFFFWFWRGFKWKKMTRKCQFQSVSFHILGTVNQFVVHKCKIISLGVFFNFLKLLIF